MRPARASPVSINACAINSGMDDGAVKLVDEMSRDAGFELLRPFTTIEAAERQAKFTPICFFLFTYPEEMTATAARIREIRRARERRIRFAPLVCFIDKPSRADIIACIMVGFDDILTVPIATGSLGPRLKFQLARPVTYFETTDYFGPDRRRHLLKSEEPKGERRRESGSFKRYEFVRNSMSGIQILRDEVVRPTAAQAAAS